MSVDILHTIVQVVSYPVLNAPVGETINDDFSVGFLGLPSLVIDL